MAKSSARRGPRAPAHHVRRRGASFDTRGSRHGDRLPRLAARRRAAARRRFGGGLGDAPRGAARFTYSRAERGEASLSAGSVTRGILAAAAERSDALAGAVDFRRAARLKRNNKDRHARQTGGAMASRLPRKRIGTWRSMRVAPRPPRGSNPAAHAHLPLRPRRRGLRARARGGGAAAVAPVRAAGAARGRRGGERALPRHHVPPSAAGAREARPHVEALELRAGRRARGLPRRGHAPPRS